MRLPSPLPCAATLALGARDRPRDSLVHPQPPCRRPARSPMTGSTIGSSAPSARPIMTAPRGFGAPLAPVVRRSGSGPIAASTRANGSRSPAGCEHLAGCSIPACRTAACSLRAVVRHGSGPHRTSSSSPTIRPGSTRSGGGRAETQAAVGRTDRRRAADPRIRRRRAAWHRDRRSRRRAGCARSALARLRHLPRAVGQRLASRGGRRARVRAAAPADRRLSVGRPHSSRALGRTTRARARDRVHARHRRTDRDAAIAVRDRDRIDRADARSADAARRRARRRGDRAARVAPRRSGRSVVPAVVRRRVDPRVASETCRRADASRPDRAMARARLDDVAVGRDHDRADHRVSFSSGRGGRRDR